MYLASWSGGKDSCFACYQAVKKGLPVSHFVHFDRKFNLHGVPPGLIRLQSELAGISIVQRTVLTDDFEREFKETVLRLKNGGVTGMIFGDIYLEPHREWLERVCGDMDIETLLPLWGMSTQRIMNDILAEGFETIIVSGRQECIDREWIGRKADRTFVHYLKGKGLDVCGENGEYHSFVVAGPLFNGRIEITGKETISRDGYWFLDIKRHEVLLP